MFNLLYSQFNYSLSLHSDFLAIPTSPNGGTGCGGGCILSVITGALLAASSTWVHD